MRRKIPRIIVMGVLTSSMFVLGAGVNSQPTKNVVDARVRNMEADNVTTGSAIVLPLVKEQTVTEKKNKKKYRSNDRQRITAKSQSIKHGRQLYSNDDASRTIKAR